MKNTVKLENEILMGKIKDFGCHEDGIDGAITFYSENFNFFYYRDLAPSYSKRAFVRIYDDLCYYKTKKLLKAKWLAVD
jgi:hypothetical protein